MTHMTVHPIDDVLAALSRLQQFVAGFDVSIPGTLEHQDLLASELGRVAEVLHAAELYAATVVALVDRECDPGLKNKAMNARLGAFRDTASLVTATLQTRYAEAARYARNGHMLEDVRQIRAANEAGEQPAQSTTRSAGLIDVADAYLHGHISGAQSHAIVKALTSKNYGLDVEDQIFVAEQLLAEAKETDVASLDKLAQHLAAVQGTKTPKEREESFRQRRSIQVGSLEDGLHRIFGYVTPEFAVELTNITDRATNPRAIERSLVGKSFEERQRIRQMSSGQLMHDAVLHRLLGHETSGEGFESSRTQIWPGRSPVTIIVRENDLGNPNGEAFLGGSPLPVPVQMAERILCHGGGQEVVFDADNNLLRLGRTVRTFTSTQRQALIARDGGCTWPGCDSRLTWVEAHHIVEWRHGGTTDIENGILLCLEHHTTVHNLGYTILKWDDLTAAQRGRAAATLAVAKESTSKSGSAEVFSPAQVLPQARVLHWLQRPPDHSEHENLLPMLGKTPWLTG